MTLGISATQVTQLVAQKLTSVTLPLRSSLDFLLPSSSTKVEAGAAETPVFRYTPTPTARASATAAAEMTFFMGKGWSWPPDFSSDRTRFDNRSPDAPVHPIPRHRPGTGHGRRPRRLQPDLQ